MKLPFIFGTRGARDKPKDSYGGQAYSFFFGRSTSGKNVNERTAMQTTAVYSCVRILAEAIASLPIHVYCYTETGKERVYDHPLYYLLHDEPNPEMDRRDRAAVPHTEGGIQPQAAGGGEKDSGAGTADDAVRRREARHGCGHGRKAGKPAQAHGVAARAGGWGVSGGRYR